ncbi:MAG TPA: alpha/beta hydrolase [Frankiaceae bacterium]|nr:alpha/beta hydrolase [Frankiaceae bacterium]
MSFSPPSRLTLVSGLAALVALLLGVIRVLRRNRRPDRVRPPDLVVHTEDGVPLAVEEDGDPNAELTVVFVHGFTAQSAEFDLQREALRKHARLVLYDQRGHGRSGWGDVRRATIDQTGRDLAAVLEARVPTGPVVVVGHSLGGMTVMALAEQRPELFGPRIVGTCLLATSAGRLVESALGSLGSALLLRTGLFRVYLWWLRLWAPTLERFRIRGSRLAYAFTRRYLFGTTDATPELVRQVQSMLEETPIPIVAAFYPAFVDHDKVAALAALRDIPVLVAVGDADRLTPAEHSEVIVQHLGNGVEHLVVPGAGHSVNFTHPDRINDALHRLLGRAGKRTAKAA